MKFRVWDSKFKKYINSSDVRINASNGECHGVRSGGNVPHWHLEQFTGLKDKNGVDICEGDIVKWGHVEGFIERIPRIAVAKLFPALHFETTNLGEHNHEFHYGSFLYARCIDKAMEVIGNIHENKEDE
ncbi:YopX family protein [Shewanella surugensis]|uniref:YopX family protein n=1 Tax=Shewanella surugensis TaxID=212020 RepID=A0ABT0L9P0_9GAMM|nr:YopX family protein [Shewanella surugensis]MCL1124200.1 YopX family protein [Shewanella surugensis]